MTNNSRYINEFTFDEPVDYKGLKIYPVTLKDYLLFGFAVGCLLDDKNSIPDAKIISMSYLDYMISTSNEKNGNVERFVSLLNICMKEKIENVKYTKDEKEKYTLFIGNIEIKGEDFDNIKEIILEQNLIEKPDYSIQKELREKIEEGKRLRSRLGGHKMASFEDQVVALSVATGMPLGEIYTMTYRKFVKSISRMDLLIHYKIFLQSSMSGMVTFKDTSFIKHWLNENEEKNSDMIELDALKKKISFEDKK